MKKYQDIIILKTVNLIGGKLFPLCKDLNSDFTLINHLSFQASTCYSPLILVSKYAMILMNDTPIIILKSQLITREGFLRKNIVAVSFFQNCAIHQYS